jgi:RNA polymerase sigma factor (sigma-70 family)
VTEEEFDNYVDAFGNRMLRLVLKFTWDKAKAEDIVQEAFAMLWTERNRISQENIRSYLFAFACRRAINEKKKEKTHQKAVAEIWEEQVSAKEYLGIGETLNEVLNLIPEEEKTALLLKDLDEQTFKEVGKTMGISGREAERLVTNARRAVKHYLVRIDNLI